MTRFLCLMAACVVAAGGGCSKSQDAKPNPEMTVPDVPAGRAGGGMPADPAGAKTPKR